jgi:hypothetical protein
MMNWDAAGAIAELIWALAAISTLVYIARGSANPNELQTDIWKY